MSNLPLVPNSNVINDNGEMIENKEGFDEACNIIHCNLSINSTTVYTYDNPSILHKVNLNYAEIITQNLGDINELQKDGMDHLDLSESLVINNTKSLTLELYYKKKLMENNDLITIVILCGDKLLSSFVHNLLERLLNIYTAQYYTIKTKYEFKLKMKEVIQEEETKLVKLYQNYGSIDDEIVQIRDIMNENIDKILKRGENLDSLIKKTSTLKTTSKTFKKNSSAVKRRFFWAKIKFWVIVCLVVVILVYILLGLECGLPFYQRCIHPSKPPQPTSVL